MPERLFPAPGRRLGAILIAAALGLGACTGPETVSPMYRELDRPGVDLGNDVVIYEVVNSYRARSGLRPLTADPVLNRLAREQAEAMAEKADVRVALTAGRKIDKRLDDAGYAHKAAAENVSAGYRTIAEAFSGWRSSKQHDAVLRHPTATRMGVATAYVPGNKYRVFWSLIVAEPAE
ncbi:uncharacterized protein YkwD [Rhodobium orientis]|uniref:SCP domain-containing protein n=1 Tax=Rhodobium orientis TaxID=34017 RepID=A0A327JFI0_9HYPH|nr:CAP domain-containing protein [Rhodobium orientis]MBB4303596.1 uncharacterized protein YkwD [Rhodobium orientis]MBK5951948.1 hypothetical protein [Rhodobium orientis]RAI24875.1 hypothetical protein CH339_20830 [Rhodobium orientis]